VNTPLPFDGFLELLRDKGYPVGLHEHFALGKVLTRLDATDPSQLRDALAAIVARSDDELVSIRALFDEFYREPPAAIVAPPPPPPPSWWRRHVWVPAALAGAVLLVAVLSQVNWRTQAPEPAPSAAAPAPAPPPAAAPDAIVQPQPPTPSDPPSPQSRLVVTAAVLLGATCFAFVLAWAWWAKARAATRRWLREAWSAALGALPGPYQVALRVRGLASPLPRTAVEDAAVLLGRIFSSEARARELDVEATLRLTISRGLAPHFVFTKVRTARPIVVLQDTGAGMDPWNAKVEALLSDLRRQGVALERSYFDGDPRQISVRPHGAWVPLATTLARRPDSPVLVVSTGSGLAAVDAVDPDWRRPLAAVQRRAWLTPVTDARLWPPGLSNADAHAWPMTRDGLTQAARQLAGMDVVDTLRAQVIGETRVGRDDIERVKRLASLVPHPTFELLELLRQRFAPDVPDAVLAHIAAQSDAHGMRVLRLSDDEVARHVAAVRAETPTLEAAVRRTMVSVLEDSRPAEGSAAHLRWRMAMAMQQVSLADLGQEPAEGARQELRELEEGPLWEEVRAATRRAAVVASSSEPASRPSEARPPADDGQLEGVRARPWVWPGLRELAAAAVGALILVAGARASGVLPTITLAHVENAYALSMASGAAATTLSLTRADASAPSTVDLYQDSTLFRSGVAIPSGGAAAIDIGQNSGHFYQARAGLSGGNQALSNPLWVENPGLVAVVVDARPWARFTIEGLTPGASERLGTQLTPVRMALAPGTYRLQLENGGLTPPLTTDITVAAGDADRRISIPMPPFDAARTVTDLVGP
jgi:hypothetical protein